VAPSFRVDVAIEDDLVEEVARSIGYDAIPAAPTGASATRATRSPREQVVRAAREAMLARGFLEATTTTLVSASEARHGAALTGMLADRLVQLENPMSREGEMLRPNLVPGLLRACAHNLRQGEQAVRLFEVGNGFAWSENGESGARERLGVAANESPQSLAHETLMVGAVLTGNRFAHAHDATQGASDFSDAKGLWEAWLEEMGVDTPEWRAYSAAGWKPGASAEVAVAASRIGWAGTLSSSMLREWEIEVPVHVFMADLGPILERRPAEIRARIPGRFPPVRRDLAFFVPAGVTYAKLERSLRVGAGERLSSVELFDVYTGPGTPEGMKGMAFALQFVHPERTMTEDEIHAIHDRIVAAVAKDCGGRLRER
jgi:phenylalanyl-tRNA synthetase beta chain